MTERSGGMAIPSTSLLAAEMRTAAIEEGRKRKRRVQARLAALVKCRREHGGVPIHVDLFLRRARANHAKAVRKARMVHAAFPTNTQGEHSPGATAEGDMLDPVVVPDFAPARPGKKVEKSCPEGLTT